MEGREEIKNRYDHIKAQVDKWKDNDVSNKLSELIKIHGDPFDKFQKSEKFYVDQIIEWLGWKNDGLNSTFKCKKCNNIYARTRIKEERGNQRMVFRCKTKGCIYEPSPQSVTLIGRSKMPIRFWFFLIYVIGLMKGEVPWTYLNEKRLNNFIESNDERKIMQQRDFAYLIYKIMLLYKKRFNRVKYSRLVQLDFSQYYFVKWYQDWYKKNRWLPWRIVYQWDRCFNIEAIKISGFDHSSRDIQKALILKDAPIFPGELLLRVEVEDGPDDDWYISTINWFYVSVIGNICDRENFLYEKGYRKTALFTKVDHKVNNNFPFKLSKKFKEILVETLPYPENADKLNTVSLPPPSFYKKLADSY